MFRNVHVRPVRGVRGNVREIVAESDRPFFTVEIECFVNDPPPPGLKPCPQCGVLASRQFRSGEPIQIDLDDMVPGAAGVVQMTLVDSNDRHMLSLQFARGMASGPAAMV